MPPYDLEKVLVVGISSRALYGISSAHRKAGSESGIVVAKPVFRLLTISQDLQVYYGSIS